MPSINYATREVNWKIVYYGPGRCGKTTNLENPYAAAFATTRKKSAGGGSALPSIKPKFWKRMRVGSLGALFLLAIQAIFFWRDMVAGWEGASTG